MGWLAFAALILSILALRRVGALGGRVRILEAEVVDLRGRLAGGDATAPQAREAAPPPDRDGDVTWAQAPIDVARETPAGVDGGAPTRPAPARPAAPVDTAPPPRPPRPPRGPTPPPPSRPRLPRMDIDWERWVGVRGAALLGGVVLALAGLYFFQYSIEHGLVPPWLRVTSGTLLGLGCIGGAEWKARARYESAANAIVGAGVVILYSAIWAAHVLYDLIGMELAFAAMIAVTAACTALSYRHASLVIALLGLIGGFSTPLVLSTGEPRPIGLFAYLLMLDSCLLFIAHRRGWPVLALLSLVGTLFYQVAWIAQGMKSGELALALVILGVFALLYAVTTRNAPSDRRQWLVAQGGGILFPLAFAIYFAANADFGRHFYPIGMLLAVVAASASWLGVVQKRNWLGLGAATGTVAVFAVWALDRPLDGALAWEAAASGFAIALLFHAFVEWKREPAGTAGPAPSAVVAALGALAVLALAATRTETVLWPWLAGWLAIAALLTRHADFPDRAPLQLAASLGVALGFWVYYGALGDRPAFPSFTVYAGVLALVAIQCQAIALGRAASADRRWSEYAAAAFALAVAFSLSKGPALQAPVEQILGIVGLLGFFALLAATRLGSGAWVFAAMAVTALTHLAWTDRASNLAGRSGLVAYALQLLAVALFTAWPFFAAERLRTARFAWYAVALAGPAWFHSLRTIHAAHFGEEAIGLLPVGLGAMALLAARQATRVWVADEPLRTSNLAWLLAVALGFATVAIPLQLEKEWITLGWALEAAGVAYLWRRLDHPGLKYFALALVLGATLRLIANEAVLGYYPRPEWRIVNWLLYTYWVSAAAFVAAAFGFRSDEVARARGWESTLYGRGHAIVAGVCGLAAIAVVFVWINLAIADWFGTGAALELSFQRLPARDLATSLSWAVYALVLLAIGVRGNSGVLRWLSLGLLMVTVGKVFLYDLGELEDLYRVASLLGLAVSLIAVSLAYQRFVVRAMPRERG